MKGKEPCYHTPFLPWSSQVGLKAELCTVRTDCYGASSQISKWVIYTFHAHDSIYAGLPANLKCTSAWVFLFGVNFFFFLSTNLLDTCIENSLAPSTLKQGSLQNCLFAGAVFILKRDLFFSK